jgi:bisphosphoglycerate-dependent phosphoglycerate mutase
MGYEIVMVRHGESEWNEKNLFSGWFDAELSDKGESIVNRSCSKLEVQYITIW